MKLRTVLGRFARRRREPPQRPARGCFDSSALGPAAPARRVVLLGAGARAVPEAASLAGLLPRSEAKKKQKPEHLSAARWLLPRGSPRPVPPWCGALHLLRRGLALLPLRPAPGLRPRSPPCSGGCRAPRPLWIPAPPASVLQVAGVSLKSCEVSWARVSLPVTDEGFYCLNLP